MTELFLLYLDTLKGCLSQRKEHNIISIRSQDKSVSKENEIQELKSTREDFDQKIINHDSERSGLERIKEEFQKEKENILKHLEKTNTTICIYKTVLINMVSLFLFLLR